ncbi:hypothetical protein J5N97_019270 [Dioscorea zingiberensis]|uniref:WRKY domain-containing protein n=1 Tax=Dioscorea zingiberensis TaxID=325984 RepID=A0A9D5HC53_9LILI|nr:hypothetical protein J5N97_019270 [Dioscorea zingiberensis]
MERKSKQVDKVMLNMPVVFTEKEKQLESTRIEMGEMKEENKRLKMFLAEISKDYQSLKMHFLDAKRQIENDVEEAELVSLSLGSCLAKHNYKEEKNIANKKRKQEENQIKDTLSLGLEVVEEETWPPCKSMKSLKNGNGEVSQQANPSKDRVSVRARCDAPTMNDGCQWRKYGQKVAKGNPCPKAYYRCSVAAGCPVKKQVQRCAEDMSILITTYEGRHNHPIPKQSYQLNPSQISSNPSNPSIKNSDQMITDSIAQAITTDPSFQSALATAIASCIRVHGVQGTRESSSGSYGHGHGGVLQERNSNECSSSYLAMSDSVMTSSHYQENLKIFQPLMCSSGAENASSTPVDDGEQ